MTTKRRRRRKPSAKLSAKDEVRALLDRLPDTVTLEDIQYHLDVVVKVLEAEASLERGEGIPHEEVERSSRTNGRTSSLVDRGARRSDEIKTTSLRDRPPTHKGRDSDRELRQAVRLSYAARMIPEFEDANRRETFVT